MRRDGVAPPRTARVATLTSDMHEEKLWNYEGLARMWSWALIGAGAALLGLATALEAGSPGGIDGWWVAAAVGISGLTGVILYPVFRVWLRRSAMPSLKLPQATRATGPRRLEATPRDWRRWAILIGLVMFLGGAATMVFLVGVLGRGGTAEGVTVGMMIAWGMATLSDVPRIRATEDAEGRRYYAACRRPTGVGNNLVWIPVTSEDRTDEGAASTA